MEPKERRTSKVAAVGGGGGGKRVGRLLQPPQPQQQTRPSRRPSPVSAAGGRGGGGGGPPPPSTQTRANNPSVRGGAGGPKSVQQRPSVKTVATAVDVTVSLQSAAVHTKSLREAASEEAERAKGAAPGKRLFYYSAIGVLGRRGLARAAMAAKPGGGGGGARSLSGSSKWNAGGGGGGGGSAGKKAAKRRPRLLKEASVSSDSSDMISTLKSTIACPSHLLKVILKQTDLDEPSIHSRYMRFRKEFPTGFISQNALLSLCGRALSAEESEVLVDAIFCLYGRNRKGWHSKLIGFREVILATECMRNLGRPERVLRWIFKVNDFNGVGAVAVKSMEDIVGQILSLCLSTKPLSTDDDLQRALVEMTMSHFKMRPYDKENISEEEFVYDCLHNEALYCVLNRSILLSAGTTAVSEAPGGNPAKTAELYVSQILQQRQQQQQQMQ